MRNRLLLLVLSSIMILALSGCGLAEPSQNNQEQVSKKLQEKYNVEFIYDSTQQDEESSETTYTFHPEDNEGIEVTASYKYASNTTFFPSFIKTTSFVDDMQNAIVSDILENGSLGGLEHELPSDTTELEELSTNIISSINEIYEAYEHYGIDTDIYMPYINIEFIFDDKSVKTSFTSTDESDIQSKITQIAWQLGTDI